MIFSSREEIPWHKLDRDNNKTNLGVKDRKRAMPIMAFCHRVQFLETTEDEQLITRFKTTIANAIARAVEEQPTIKPWLLTDPKFGQDALRIAEENDWGVICPIEASGSNLTSWLEDRSAYQILRNRPANWGVKLLWHYSDKLDTKIKEHQLKKLTELYDACLSLDRKLMLEVLPWPHLDHCDQSMLTSIAQAYEQKIYPYWLKLPAFSDSSSYVALDKLVQHHDDEVAVVMLGGTTKPLSDYQQDITAAKSIDRMQGFAVGRSIFWPAWQKVVAKEISLTEAESLIKQAYLSFYLLWHKS